MCRANSALGRRLLEAVPVLAATDLPALIESASWTAATTDTHRPALPSTATADAGFCRCALFPFLSGVTMFWNDITDRADAETALKHSEERYALAAAGANDGLWDWDLEHDDDLLLDRAGMPCSACRRRAGAPSRPRIGSGASTLTISRRSAPRSMRTWRVRPTHFQHEHRMQH